MSECRWKRIRIQFELQSTRFYQYSSTKNLRQKAVLLHFRYLINIVKHSHQPSKIFTDGRKQEMHWRITYLLFPWNFLTRLMAYQVIHQKNKTFRYINILSFKNKPKHITTINPYKSNKATSIRCELMFTLAYY